MGAAVRLVEDDSLRATADGYEIRVRLNWYRSLPLSCIEKVALSLDGQPVAADALRFGINGHSYRLDELPELVEEFWFVQDSAKLIVQQPGKVIRGKAHSLDVEIALRFPYIAIGPGKYLVNTTTSAATQVAG
jgi:hypothetical protein